MFAENITGDPICIEHASSPLKRLINTSDSMHTTGKRFITLHEFSLQKSFLPRKNKQWSWGKKENHLSSKESASLSLCCSGAQCTSLSILTWIPLLLSWPAEFCQPTALLGGRQRATAHLQKLTSLFLCWKEETQHQMFPTEISPHC